jgi:hypothetical protein
MEMIKTFISELKEHFVFWISLFLIGNSFGLSFLYCLIKTHN